MQHYPSCSLVGLDDYDLGLLCVYVGSVISPDFSTKIPVGCASERELICCAMVSFRQDWNCVSSDCLGKVTHKVAWGCFVGSTSWIQCL